MPATPSGPERRICYTCADEISRRAMAERPPVFVAYLSSDLRTVRTWSGGLLGNVVRSSAIPNPAAFGGWRRNTQIAVTVIDTAGGRWHGRGAGANMAIRLHPSKSST